MKKIYRTPSVKLIEITENIAILSGSEPDPKTRFSDTRPTNGETGGADASDGEDYGDARAKGWNGFEDFEGFETPNWDNY